MYESIKQSIIGGIVEDFTTATRNHTDPLLIEQHRLLLAVDAFLIDQPNDFNLLIQATEAYSSYGALLRCAIQKAIPIFERAHAYGKRAFAVRLNLENIDRLPFKILRK